MSARKKILRWLIHDIAFFKIFFNSVVHDSHKPKQAIKIYKKWSFNHKHRAFIEAKDNANTNYKC